MFANFKVQTWFQNRRAKAKREEREKKKRMGGTVDNDDLSVLANTSGRTSYHCLHPKFLLVFISDFGNFCVSPGVLLNN